MAVADNANLVVTLSLRDGLSKGIIGAQKNLKRLKADFSRTGDSLHQFGRNLKFFGGAVAGAAAIAVDQFAKFEDQLATINTVANVSDEQLQAIGKSLQSLAVETGTALPELTSAYYDLVSAGVQAKDATLVLTSASKLAIGGLATTGETVDLLTTAINSYGLKAQEVTRVTDGFAQAIALGKVTAAELAGSFATVAPLASAAGIGIDELQAGYAQLTAAGVPAAEAATQMRAAIVALTKPTSALQKVQGKLGINFAKIAKNKGLAVAYQTLRREARGLGIDASTLLTRVEAQSFMFSVTGRNAEKYALALKAIRNSSKDGGVAQQQFEKRQKTLAASLSRLREVGRNVAIIFGTALAPALKRLSIRLTKFVTDHLEDIQKIGTGLGDLLDQLASKANIDKAFTALQNGLDAIANIDWTTVRGAFSTTAEIVKTSVKMFDSLPDPIKQGLITLLAVNKVTGGLAGSLIKDIGGIFLRSLTTINAANVTVIGANVTGGGGGKGGIFDWVGSIATGIAAGIAGIPGLGLTVGAALAAIVGDVAVTPIVRNVSPTYDTQYQTMFGDVTVLDRIQNLLFGKPLPGNQGLLGGNNQEALARAINAAFRSGFATGGTGGAGRKTAPGLIGQASPGTAARSQLDRAAAMIVKFVDQGRITTGKGAKIYEALVQGNMTYKEALKELGVIKGNTARTEQAVKNQTTTVTVQPSVTISATATGNAISFAGGVRRIIIR